MQRIISPNLTIRNKVCKQLKQQKRIPKKHTHKNIPTKRKQTYYNEARKKQPSQQNMGKTTQRTYKTKKRFKTTKRQKTSTLEINHEHT